MNAIAHSTFAAPLMTTEKKALDQVIQAEISEAKRIQAQTGCTWTEALKAAAKRIEP
jgi:hypothetical protein